MAPNVVVEVGEGAGEVGCGMTVIPAGLGPPRHQRACATGGACYGLVVAGDC
jgi:hypothetical protein